MRKMLIAGHRGNPVDYAENTMPSFQSAVDLGVDMIETDIHMTKDGNLVLIHDPSLDRTTDGHGLVRDKTLSEIRRCNAAAKEGGTERIPTLDEFLDEFVHYPNLQFNLELKDYPSECGAAFGYECVVKVIDSVERHGLAERCILNSFNAQLLEYIHAKYPHRYRLHGFYPYRFLLDQSRDPAEYLYCACLVDGSPCPRQSYFDDLLARGIEPWLGASLTEREDFALAIQRGGRLVTTNDPRTAISIVSALSEEECHG